MLDPKRLQAAGRLGRARWSRALEKSNANAGGGYIEHNREHFVIGTDGLVQEPRRSAVASSIGATPQGVPITVATVGDVRFGPRLRRGAATEGRQGRGRRRRGADADGRELAHRHRGGEGQARGARSRSLPPGTRDRAVLRPRRAGRPHHQDRRARTCSRARCWSIAGAAAAARRPARRAGRGRHHPALAAVRGHR